MKVLITGGMGFIGSNFVHYILQKYPDGEIVVLDKLTYAGRIENLQGVMDKIIFIKGDICSREDIEKVGDCGVIFNFAAETHVDRSIIDAGVFVKTDVLGTYNLLEYARRNGIEKYIQISTDEVYGSIEKGSFKEEDILDPSSPYSASKAGADLLCHAYFKTHGLPILITRSSNNFGPYQYPEKLIPVLVINALQNKPLPIYGNGMNVRDWIYVLDNCEAIDLVSKKGKNGEIYNVASGNEKANIEIANFILEELNKPKDLIKFVNDRPGHDFRYSLDFARIKKLGWKPKYDFENAIKDTIHWYIKNEWWWKSLI
ncbi:MAG: dTDP-glucose 4,6-dehydratase [Methanophagales archaeon]|nr:dTDP-glucose 4,6-dehydratase [Methanophagales archaeon]